MTQTSDDDDLNFVDVTIEEESADNTENKKNRDPSSPHDQSGSRNDKDDLHIQKHQDDQEHFVSESEFDTHTGQDEMTTIASENNGEDFVEFTLDDDTSNSSSTGREAGEKQSQNFTGHENHQQANTPESSAMIRDETESNTEKNEQSSHIIADTEAENQNSGIISTGSDLVHYGESNIDASGHADEQAQAGDGSGRIGDRMVAAGVITPDQLNVALQEKKISGKLLGQTLVDLGFIDEQTLTSFLAESSGAEIFDPRNTIMDSEALDLLDRKEAEKLQVLPISYNEDELVVAMADPYDVVAQDTLRQVIPKNVKLRTLITSPSVIGDAIDAAYGYASNIEDILKELEHESGEVDITVLEESETYSHPIVRLVNALLIDAVKRGVSDLHFEPEENFVRLRYRMDGVLFTAQILHKKHWRGISQRLKIMSNMNIADKLTAQDGRFNLNVGGREADFRVSSLPTVYGENIVLRVLDKSASIMSLEKLGFSEHNLDKIKRSQSSPEGIIIVTGPTGSGKSTTLYSMLSEINDVEVNIQTLEDPVEYSIPMLRQTHVREGVLEFGDGIRAILRQDPDIVFIGEIRDNETAEMALKAAMTGHQVYTTLHTNDSFSAIPRLIDLGLKQSMISGNIISVFAQRLARRLCEECKQAFKPDREMCEMLGIDPQNPPTIYEAKSGGCPNCGGQGYKGRVALAEILMLDEELDEIIADGGTKAQLVHKAREKGFKNITADGILKILEGITSIEAVSKVVDLSKV